MLLEVRPREVLFRELCVERGVVRDVIVIFDRCKRAAQFVRFRDESERSAALNEQALIDQLDEHAIQRRIRRGSPWSGRK